MRKLIKFISGIILFPFIIVLGKEYYDIIHNILYNGDEDAKRLSNRLTKRNQVYATKENSRHFREMYFLNLRNRELELRQRGEQEANAMSVLSIFANQMQEAMRQNSDDEEQSSEDEDIMKDILNQEHLGPQ